MEFILSMNAFLRQSIIWWFTVANEMVELIFGFLCWFSSACWNKTPSIFLLKRSTEGSWNRSSILHAFSESKFSKGIWIKTELNFNCRIRINLIEQTKHSFTLLLLIFLTTFLFIWKSLEMMKLRSRSFVIDDISSSVGLRKSNFHLMKNLPF